MANHLTATAIYVNRGLQLADVVGFRASLRKMPWANGEELNVWIEPKGEAIRLSDFRHLYGHIYLPVIDYTGRDEADLHLQAKAKFMPDDGRTSVTQLDREEFLRFKDQTEEWLRLECWEAFEAWDPETYRRKRELRKLQAAEERRAARAIRA